jgi:hypothetical protein
MKADIERPEVTDIGVAIVKEKNEVGEDSWNSYLINMKDHAVGMVFVSSRGYGTIQGEKRETSMLRHYLDEVSAHSYLKIEPIMEEVFRFTNEYWVSFFDEGKMFDKKYIFASESISEQNFTLIPVIGKKGVLIV